MLRIITDSELTLIASYKSRHGDYRVTLVNPSSTHLRRLNSVGNEILLQWINSTGDIVKSGIIKY